MEEKELLEIEARESEQAKKNVEEMVRTHKIGDIELLYRDKFDLEHSKTCHRSAKEILVQALIPIYEKVLLTVPPIVDSARFQQWVGFGVAEVMEWRRRGWVETMLNAPHKEYAGLDYLDELISASPSSSARTQPYLETLVGGADRFDSLYVKGMTLLKGTKTFKDIAHPIASYFGEQKTTRKIPMILASYYLDLSVFGLTHMVRWIEEYSRKEPYLSVSLLAGSERYLIRPFLQGLRKTSVYGSEDKRLATIMHEVAKPDTEVFFTPYWLVDVYADLGASIPQTMDIDEINAVRKHSEDFVQAVKSLDEEIDRSVKEKFQGGELNKSEREMILAKKGEFRRRWFEDVVPAFEDLSDRERYWSIGMTGSIVAPALALPAFTGVLGIPPALAALAASDKIKKLVDPAAEFLSTFFECNPIHLGFYKVHRELKKVKHRSVE